MATCSEFGFHSRKTKNKNKKTSTTEEENRGRVFGAGRDSCFKKKNHRGFRLSSFIRTESRCTSNSSQFVPHVSAQRYTTSSIQTLFFFFLSSLKQTSAPRTTTWEVVSSVVRLFIVFHTKIYYCISSSYINVHYNV